MDQSELDKRWFSWEPIEGVQYGLNDTIEITGGEHSGERGSVISLLAISPVTYLVELGSGRGDARIAELNLKLIEKHHEHMTEE